MMKCQHPEHCQYRYRDKGITRRYCMGCLFEKVKLREINQPQTSIKEDLDGVVLESKGNIEIINEMVKDDEFTGEDTDSE